MPLPSERKGVCGTANLTLGVRCREQHAILGELLTKSRQRRLTCGGLFCGAANAKFRECGAAGDDFWETGNQVQGVAVPRVGVVYWSGRER